MPRAAFVFWIALLTACASSVQRPTSEAPPHARGECGTLIDGCHLRTAMLEVCSGQDRESDEVNQYPVCVCDLCRDDGECGGGRCELTPGNMCEPDRRVCVYPSDPCWDPSSCERGRCMHEGGAAVCREPDPPPD